MLRIVNAFSEEQVDRYELFRRSCFPRNQIKRLMQQVSNTQVNQQVCIAMAGVAKVFVGELVEEALKAMGLTYFQFLPVTHSRYFKKMFRYSPVSAKS